MNNELNVHVTITDLTNVEGTLEELIENPALVWSGDSAHRFGEHAAFAGAGSFYKVQRVGDTVRVQRFDTRRQLRTAVRRYNELF